ncbi:hypothetical protein GCM10023068_44260 [Leifsonia shinshuensis]
MQLVAVRPGERVEGGAVATERRVQQVLVHGRALPAGSIPGDPILVVRFVCVDTGDAGDRSRRA